MNKRLPGRRYLGVLIAILICPCFAFSAQPLLTWKNDETLKGELLGSSETHLTWQSQDFGSPFEIDLRWLSRISFTNERMSRPAGQAVVSFTTGDWITAELLGIDEESLYIRNQAAGELKLSRSWVRDVMVNPDTESSGFIGSVAEQSWRFHHGADGTDSWHKTPSGGLTTTSLNASMYRPLELHDRVLLFVKLSWQESARFVVSFFEPNGANTSHHPFPIENFRGKIWAFANGRRYAVPTKQNEVHIQIAWNRLSGNVLILGEKGFVPIAKIKKQPKERTGIYIRNKGKDLTVESIRVLRWNGDSTGMLTSQTDWLQSPDGRFTRGRLRSLDGDKFILQKDQERVTVDRSEIATIYFQSLVNAAQRNRRNVQIVHVDGSAISGILHHIDKSNVVLETAYCEKPIPFRRPQIRSMDLVFPKPQETGTPTATLNLLDGDLSGTFVMDSNQPERVFWKLPGSRHASELTSPNARIHFKRTHAKPIQKSMDVMFLRNHDIVLCEIDRINDKWIQFSTNLGAGRITHDQVKAIEFNSDVAAGGFGFEKPDWQVLDNSNNGKAVAVEKGQLTFHGNGMIGHPHVIRDGEVSFSIRQHDTAVARCEVRLLASPTLRRRSGNTQQFFVVNDKVYFVSGENRRHTRVIAMSNDTARIRYQLSAKKIECFVDDALVYSTPITKNDGTGILFGVTGFQAKKPEPTGKLQFYDLHISAGRNLSNLSQLSERQVRLLTLPRANRNPPQHIVVATNGDMLRGKLVGLKKGNVEFSTGDDVIQIPRSRIATLVWINRNVDGIDRLPTVDLGSSRLVFLNGTAITLKQVRFEKGNILGHSTAIGDCAFSMHLVKQIQRGTLIDQQTSHRYMKWTLRDAPQPKFAN